MVFLNSSIFLATVELFNNLETMIFVVVYTISFKSEVTIVLVIVLSVTVTLLFVTVTAVLVSVTVMLILVTVVLVTVTAVFVTLILVFFHHRFNSGF